MEDDVRADDVSADDVAADDAAADGVAAADAFADGGPTDCKMVGEFMTWCKPKCIMLM